MDDPQYRATRREPTRRRDRRRQLPSRPVLALGAAVVIFFLLLLTFVAYEFLYRDRVISGVRVLGEPMSGLTRAESKKLLQDKFGEPEAILKRMGGEAIVLRDGDRSWRAWPWELGLRTDFGPVAESAILLGHRGSLFENVVEQARCLVLGCDLGSEAQFDIQIAQSYLRSLAPQVERPARDAAVRIEGVHAVVAPAQNGRELDGATTLERMRQRVLGDNRGEIALAFRETTPLIGNADSAQALAESILATPLVLTFSGRSWVVDQGTLAGMISIQRQQGADGKLGLITAIDHKQMVAQLKTIARDINQPARDARFHFNPETGALTTLVTSQYGQTLDPEAAAKQIEQQLLANTARVPGSAKELFSARQLALPVNVVKPTVAMEDANKLGIKELVSQGVSNFKGSTPGRVQNVRTATAQFEGVVVPPGGTFSFDQYLGEVVEANGYDDAYVIFQDRTVLGPGGGVCQVSTTVFRAAFWAGFPIVERWAHAYRVGYYEPPVGFDATVFAPSVDFKFKNDTDAHLLIQPTIDLKKTTLTFNFYGTKPNRTVEMEDPIQERIIPHGPAVYTNDPTLKKGVTKQVDTAHDGMDVTIWRNIKVNGQVVKRDKFFSRYDPWVARYLVGTKQ